MKKYEGVFIIDSEAGEDEAKTVITKLEEAISKYEGKIVKRGLERRRFAYEIKRRREGYYFSIEFGAPPKVIGELRKFCNLEDSVLRHLILRKTEGAGEGGC